MLLVEGLQSEVKLSSRIHKAWGNISPTKKKKGIFLKRKENVFTKPLRAYHKYAYTHEQMKQEFTKKTNDTYLLTLRKQTSYNSFHNYRTSALEIFNLKKYIFIV